MNEGRGYLTESFRIPLPATIRYLPLVHNGDAFVFANGGVHGAVVGFANRHLTGRLAAVDRSIYRAEEILRPARVEAEETGNRVIGCHRVARTYAWLHQRVGRGTKFDSRGAYEVDLFGD